MIKSSLPGVSSECCPHLSCNPRSKTVSSAHESKCDSKYQNYFLFCLPLLNYLRHSKEKSTAFVTESVIWVFLKLVIFSPNDTCQMRFEQWAITFRLAYQTITVMTDCLLWLQHASQNSASWYRYLSVCGLTNFTRCRTKLITYYFSEKTARLWKEKHFSRHTAMFCHQSINLKVIFMCHRV